jgi:adenylylsulfate kinase
MSDQPYKNIDVDGDKSSDVVWHEASVSHEDRVVSNKHKPAVLWFTGLSGSGKSTVANAVDKMLHDLGCKTYVLDGDNVRHGLNGDLTFTDEDRIENIRRIGEVSKLFVDAGLIVSTAFISPFITDREMVRKQLVKGEFIEVFVDTPLDICEQRDPKGLYKKARTGEIKNFTGISSTYEAPINAEIVVKTAELSVEECARQVVRYLEGKGKIKAVS